MKGNKTAGLFLILFGGLYLALQLLDELNIVLFEFWDLWPLLTVCLGVMFELSHFKSKKSPGLLIPGGILTTIGLLHLFESLTNWQFARYLWPVYVLALLIGFFQYWLATKEPWSLVMTYIFLILFLFMALIVLSMIFRGVLSMSLILSIILIVLGLLILFGGGSGRHKRG